MALTFSAAMPTARAQDADDPTIHLQSYVEVTPAAAKQTADILKQLAEASRKETNVVRFEVLQRSEHAGHFAIVEVWKDKAALDAHNAAAHTKQFREKLTPLLISPVDERLCNSLAVAATSGGGRGVYVMTHVDIAGPNPQNRDAFIPVLKAFAEAARKAAGNLRYDVMQQPSRTNHFQVVEVWEDQKANDAHEVSAPNKAYRVRVNAMQGALYDQRWYSAL
jgi:quinol monooxygenase YgiN